MSNLVNKLHNCTFAFHHVIVFLKVVFDEPAFESASDLYFFVIFDNVAQIFVCQNTRKELQLLKKIDIVVLVGSVDIDLCQKSEHSLIELLLVQFLHINENPFRKHNYFRVILDPLNILLNPLHHDLHILNIMFYLELNIFHLYQVHLLLLRLHQLHIIVFLLILLFFKLQLLIIQHPFVKVVNMLAITFYQTLIQS